MLKQTDEVLTEGLKAANQATKTQAKDLAATKAELKAELQEISMRCSVLESELRTVSVTKAGPDMTMVKEMVVREVTFQCTEHRRTQSQGPESQGDVVHIFKRSFSAGHLSTTVDPAEGPGGHRRLQAAGCELEQHSPAINSECCIASDSDCSGGILRTCDERCAVVRTGAA